MNEMHEFSKRERFTRIVFAVFTFIFFVTLTMTLIRGIIDPSSMKNGSDIDLKNFSVDSLTDEQIASTPGRYSAFSSSQRSSGGYSGVRDSRYSDYDRDRCSYSAKKITGIMTVSATKVKNSTLNLTIESNLKAGEMKIVVVRDNEILEYVDVSQTCELSYESDGEHFYYVKIICNKAQASISVSRNISGGAK